MTALLLAVSIGLICVLLVVFLRQRLFSPAIAFTLPFFVSAVILVLNTETWKVDLSFRTVGVVLMGIIFFLCGVLVADRISGGKMEAEDVRYIRVNQKLLLVVGAIQTVIMVVTFAAILKVATANGITGGVAEKIAGYKKLGTFTTEDIGLGGLLDWLYIFNIAVGYVWAFMLANNFVAARRIDKLVLLNFGISMATSLEKGGRQTVVQLLCALVVMGLMLSVVKNGDKVMEWVKKRKVKVGILACVVVVVGVLGFQMMAKLAGREKSIEKPFQYFSVYMSGELNNLNLFMEGFDEWKTPSVPGKMTFVFMNRYLGSKFGNKDLIYNLDLPFRTANGYNTGNVYTTFYAFLYDFGYAGLIILSFAMGLVSQILYKKCFMKRASGSPINVVMILYSTVFYMILFSFFSNKFYEGVFNLSMVKYVIVWYGMAAVLNWSYRRNGREDDDASSREGEVESCRKDERRELENV